MQLAVSTSKKHLFDVFNKVESITEPSLITLSHPE
jgi:hypothetical protein